MLEDSGAPPDASYGASSSAMPFKLAKGSPARTLRFGPRDRVSPEQVIEAAGWNDRRGTYQHFLLLVTCVTIASEAAEVALLSLILPHVQVEFALTSWETDQVAMSIFAGQMLGCFLMGALADAVGRKPCTIIATAMVAIGGYASALAPDRGVLMACRFAVGLGVGAAFVPVDMLAEACPDAIRATRLQIASLSFSVGVVLITVLGAWMLDPGGWRLLAFVTALPPTLALAMSFWLDESPTWLAERGRGDKAKKSLDRVCAENTGMTLPRGVEIVSEGDLKKNDGKLTAHESGSSAEDLVGLGFGMMGGNEGESETARLLELGGGAGSAAGGGRDPGGLSAELGERDAKHQSKCLAQGISLYNLAGTPTNAFRTVCLWTLAFVQTFNFYGLMLHSPVVFRKEQRLPDGTADASKIVFDYAAILIVNSGDILGNGGALFALRNKLNPRRVAAGCAAVSLPLLFVPLSETLNRERWGLVLMMLIGRVPAAPIGAMSWILNAVAYPTLFRATGHGWANAVARFGAVAASAMYSAPAAVSIPIHAVALACAVPAALMCPVGSLEVPAAGTKVTRGR